MKLQGERYNAMVAAVASLMIEELKAQAVEQKTTPAQVAIAIIESDSLYAQAIEDVINAIRARLFLN